MSGFWRACDLGARWSPHPFFIGWCKMCGSEIRQPNAEVFVEVICSDVDRALVFFQKEKVQRGQHTAVKVRCIFFQD